MTKDKPQGDRWQQLKDWLNSQPKDYTYVLAEMLHIEGRSQPQGEAFHPEYDHGTLRWRRADMAEHWIERYSSGMTDMEDLLERLLDFMEPAQGETGEPRRDLWQEGFDAGYKARDAYHELLKRDATPPPAVGVIAPQSTETIDGV